MSTLIASIQATLQEAARQRQPFHMLRISSSVHARLLEEYPGDHPELPVEPIRQLSTDFGIVDVVVDDRVWIDVVADDGAILAARAEKSMA